MAATEELGIPQLDKLLEGMPGASSLALVNDPGVDAEPFLYQAANHHLKNGRHVVYVVFNRPPSSVVKGFRDFGFDIDAHRDELSFVDAFSPMMGSSEGAPYTLEDPKDVAGFADVLTKAVRDHPGAVLMVDSLSTLIDAAGPADFVEAFPGLDKALREFALAVTLITRWPYSEDFEQVLGAFDGLVTLKGVESRVQFSQYFAVERASWMPDAPARPQLYKTMKPGGVYVYIPKIVITGPYNSGKSTFVQAVSDTSVSVDRLGTTVALDHGHVTLDGLVADVFGTPGQSRFDPIIRTVAGQALGVLVMVDSTNPDTFPRAHELLDQTWKQGLPAVIVANKQDAPGAMSPKDVAAAIRVPEGVRVEGCSAQNREDARRVLRDLIDQIMLRGATA